MKGKQVRKRGFDETTRVYVINLDPCQRKIKDSVIVEYHCPRSLYMPDLMSNLTNKSNRKMEDRT